MLLADLVAASSAVTATRARTAKVAALADLLRRLAADEVEAAVGFLTGTPRQGRIGVGWRTLTQVRTAAADRPTLTVGDVDAALGRIQRASGPGSTGERQRLLTELLGRATPVEAAFLGRLLVGELRQGALEGVMTDAVVRAAGVPADVVRRAVMYTGDLGRTARLALTEGAAGLAGVGLEVGRPVLPMLAATATGVADALEGTGPASVEWKLDGARIQVHRDGDDVAIYTRNLNEVTERLPGIAAAVAALPATRLVLDGEAIGLADDDRPHRFQDTMSRFGRERDDSGASLLASFFDVLHYDGADLVDEPLSTRLTVLGDVAGPLQVPHVVTADPVTAEAFLADAIARGHEGVMVKALESTYDAGRRGGAWRKVKPVHLLDLVVLAAEWGHGRRRGWLSNLHLGARNPADGSFVMVGKTFKGLTDDLLTWQTERLQALALGTDGDTVHVRPDLVVEIAVDGVQASRRYPGGVALRFARVRRYRPDKHPSEADTIDTVRALLAP